MITDHHLQSLGIFPGILLPIGLCGAKYLLYHRSNTISLLPSEGNGEQHREAYHDHFQGAECPRSHLPLLRLV